MRYTRNGDQRDERASDDVIEWGDREPVDVVWRLLLSLCDAIHADNVKLVSNFGAGPLESFIVRFGDERWTGSREPWGRSKRC